MTPSDIRIPSKIAYALDRLRQAGYEAYAVGGCVRDALMGIEPHDWDIATSAEPHSTKKVFSDHRQIDDGMKHGTVLVLIDGEPIEITTFRVDGAYTDGRRPDSVAFTARIEDDLARRDFTINACALGSAAIIDPFEGQADLNARLIRCVGDPVARFTEDALRILRGIRFSAVLDFQVEEKTKEAMLACRSLLTNVSQERITAELLRTLTGKNVYRALSDFQEILLCIIPELRPAVGFDQRTRYHIYTVFDHILKAVGAIEPDPILRGVMLFHDIGKPACFSLDNRGAGHFYGHPKVSAELTETILRRMRFPSEYIRSVVGLVRVHDLKIGHSPADIKKALNRMGETDLRRLFKVQRADALAQNPAFATASLEHIRQTEKLLEEVLLQKPCVSLGDLAIDGGDLLGLGIPEGKRIGEILHKLLTLVLEDRLENRREDLLEAAKRFVRQME